MSTTTELAVCFADVCDSTALFERHGDGRARDIVSRTLQLIAEEIESHEGTIVKSLGDGVLGTFPEVPPGAQAAVQLPEVVQADDELASLGIQIRVGLCYGSVLRQADGDVFGDAVNTASRLADWARADQVVTTVDARDELPDYLQSRTRTLGETILRGKDEPVTIVELLRDDGQTNLTVVQSPETAPIHEQERLIRLEYDDERVTMRTGRLSLGRGPQVDVRVQDTPVSREHAFVDRHRDSFRIVDQSTNGTYVQIESEDPLFLHHEKLLLHGTGTISLGRPPKSDEAQPLHFTCTTEPAEDE